MTVFSLLRYHHEVNLHRFIYTLFAGTGLGDQKEAGPFVIEWIPDVLPRCHMGELRISFEFGHQQSGQLDYCEKVSRRS